MDYEKSVLKRYIDNELQCKDFVSNKNYVQIKDEVLLFGYFAGHGCADTNQYFVLNESDIKKAFWNVEFKLIKLARRCGSALKIFAVYDICREPKAVTEGNIRAFNEK